MIKNDKHIEIVCSSTVWLSSMSAKSRNAIHNVLLKHYKTVGISIVNNIKDLDALVALQPDLVFLGMKFIPKDKVSDKHSDSKIWITEYLDKHDILYTGSGYRAHELELNKDMAKQRVQDYGLETSPFFTVPKSLVSYRPLIKLAFPLFVKPTNRGGGQGIDSKSVVYSDAQLSSKIQSISLDEESDSLVEEYLPGREFSVGIMKNSITGKLVTLPLELIAPEDGNGARVLSEEVKSADTESAISVADGSLKDDINELALATFKALGGRDYGRIDIRLNILGIPQFLEANLVPSLIDGFGNFPKACSINIGLGYEAMILQIVNLAFARPPEIRQIIKPIEVIKSVLAIIPEPILEAV